MLTTQAQEVPASGTEAGTPTNTVKVKARRNSGDQPYSHYFYYQGLVESYLPPRPHMIDFLYRISFTELSETEQDDYVPQGWAIALVGDGFEQTVPIARGGYFLLPKVSANHTGVTVMFKDQSDKAKIGIGWLVHVGPDQRLRYADFGKAMDEIHLAQHAMPYYHRALDATRSAKYDGLKACFFAPGGTLLIDGKPGAQATVGNCAIVKFDSAKTAGDHVIEFQGPLQLATIVETAPYRDAGNWTPP
ncbi:MAG: hypothetical protein WCC39_10710 [Telluria sp.]